MMNITITEQTPNNMLRAIRAACNELLGETTPERQILNEVVLNIKNDEKAAQHVAASSDLDQAAASLSARNAQGGPVDAGQFYRVGEQPSEQTALGTAQADAPETDSSGAEWNSELHASTKAKNQDGTWKKRRGAASLVAQSDSAAEQATQAVAATIAASPGATQVHDEVQVPALPPLPPTPPAPATPLVTMNDIYALITNNKCVLNDVIAAAQAMGFADVGAFSRDATPEQRAQLLAQLTAGAGA